MGMNWKLAQRIPVTLPGAYWLVPARRSLCIVDQGSLGNPAVGTACTRTSDAITHGVASITVSRADPVARTTASRLIVGVAPDGAREVQVHTGRAVATASISGAVFVLRDAVIAPPESFSLH
jgi:hypothetical protein